MLKCALIIIMFLGGKVNLNTKFKLHLNWMLSQAKTGNENLTYTV